MCCNLLYFISLGIHFCVKHNAIMLITENNIKIS